MAAPVYLRFPPGQGHVVLPSRPARVAAGGTVLYTASRPVSLAVQRLVWLGARAGAARLLPGERVRWEPPITAEDFAELRTSWTRLLGRPIEGLAAYERPQRHRAGLVVLVVSGSTSMVVRLRDDAATLALERHVSERAVALGLDAFRVPRLRGAGTAGQWHWVAYEVMGRRPHAPARAATRAVLEQATALVEDVLPRPADVPTHWRGAHGDLTPWNLRRASGRTWLIDWEDARYAPPDADEVYWAVTHAALAGRRSTVGRRLPTEASRYWLDDLARREAGTRDAALIDRLSRLLTVWSGAS